MNLGKITAVDHYDDVAPIKLGPQCQGFEF